MGMNEELIEEYIASFESLSADEYFDEMKSRIEQDDGVAMFLQAVKYEMEGRVSKADELYAKADISQDEAWALHDFMSESVLNNLDHDALNSKLFNALITSPSEVENLWEFHLPEAPKLGLYCYHEDYDCGCERDRADRVSKNVWGKPLAHSWSDFDEQQEADNWIYKWYYPMACQQGMPEISYQSALDRFLTNLWENSVSHNLTYFKHDPRGWSCRCISATREEYGITSTREGDICKNCRRFVHESVEITGDRLTRSTDSISVSNVVLPTAEEALRGIIGQEADVFAVSSFLVNLIDEYLTNLFIDKGGANYCKVTKGIYELDRGLTEEAVEASK